MGVDDPRVADLGRALHGPVVVGRHPDRRMRPLHRPDGRGGPGQPAVRRLEVHGGADPEPLDHIEMRHEALHPLARPHTEGPVLHLAVAQPHAEDEAPARHDVKARRLLGHSHRVQQRQEVDRDGQAHRAGLGGQPGRRHRRLEHRKLAGQEVLPEHHGFEAEVAGQPHLRHRLGEALERRVGGGMLIRHQETEAHYQITPFCPSAAKSSRLRPSRPQ